MKSRLSYFLISGIIIFSLVIWVFFWQNQHLKEVPKFKEKSFTAPISSKYVPINADLVFHWKINPTSLPNYIENYQDKVNKNIANKKVRLIRDSSFKLISIDFAKEISSWSGDYGTFALFETNKKLFNDWLLILETNKDINVEEELESISDLDIIDQHVKSINNPNTSKSKLFSKKIDTNKSIYFSNENEHILISSNPKIIESSIDNLANNKLSKKENYKNFKLKNSLNDGILLLELSPKKILNLITQEKDLLGIDQVDKLISSVNIENKKLILEGILAYDIKNKRPINDLSYDLINIEKEIKPFDNSIFINNPKQYFEKDPIHPYQKLIASFIRQSTTEDYSNMLKIILENTKGVLVWLKDKNWLVMTSKAYTEKNDINNILKNERFLNSKLDLENKDLEIWSKITYNDNEKYEIKENIETIIEDNKDSYIWSRNLSSILDFDNTKYLQNSINTKYQETEDNDFDDVIRIHLGEEKTEVFLNNFYPYILIRTMLGNKLDFPKNIDISLTIPKINYPDFIKYKIKLKTS